jgi:hypothetical protein
MGSYKRALVVTSVAGDDHPVLKSIAKDSIANSVDFIMVGDAKSPDSFRLEGCEYLSLEDQRNLDFRFSALAPVSHYSRKNIGYLLAFRKGYREIQETDDDNIPLQPFWLDYDFDRHGEGFENTGWTNIYRYFTDTFIWPRGFPLDRIREKNEITPSRLNTFCPIIQGMADENPDVDAIYRLTMELPVHFNKTERFYILGSGAWCPFNSQNTLWEKSAFPLLYLPSYCSFRMTDIRRSFVAQRICWEYGWGVLFHHPTVYQIRNDHRLLKDFEDEIPGYLQNGYIAVELEKLTLDSRPGSIYDNLLTCYQRLVEINVIGKEEIPLLEAWIHDCKSNL